MMAIAVPRRSEMLPHSQAKSGLAQTKNRRDLPISRLSCEQHVLGRRSIEARRLSPVTSSEYMQVRSRYSIKSSFDLDANRTTTATARYSQASVMDSANTNLTNYSHDKVPYPGAINSPTFNHSSSPAAQSGQQVLINQNTHDQQPNIPPRKRSRTHTSQAYTAQDHLPSILDEGLCTPSKRYNQQAYRSRFSTSPGRPARSRIPRPPVPRIPELFVSTRPSMDQLRPKKRFASTLTSNIDSFTSNGNPDDMQAKGKQSFSNLRKLMMGGNQTAKAKTTSKMSTDIPSLDQMQKYTGITHHRAQRMGAKTPPMPVTIEVAPYEFASDIEPKDVKSQIYPSHARTYDQVENKRDTLLIRGSWVDFGKCVEEVESAKNGKSKGWWTKLMPHKKKSSIKGTPLTSLSEMRSLEYERTPFQPIAKGRTSVMDFFKEEEKKEVIAKLSEDQMSPSIPPPLPPPKAKQFDDDHTQRTVGSSILYLDENLSRPDVIQCASPERMSPTAAKCQNANDIPHTAPLRLSTKRKAVLEESIHSPTMIKLPLTPGKADEQSNSSLTSTMDATEVLYDLLGQFKNDNSPSTINSNSQITNRSRPVPSSIMLPEFEMVTPQNLRRFTTAKTRSLTVESNEKKLNRATCTTMETIMSYQSSDDSSLSSLGDIDEAMEASQEKTVEADASGVATAYLNDLIDGVQHDISISSRSNLNSHGKASLDISAPRTCSGHQLKPAASHSTMDSAYSGSAWPIQRSASQFRVLGANIVARELRMTDTRKFDDSPCPGGRVVKIRRDESKIKEMEQGQNNSFNTDLTVSHVFVPDFSLQQTSLPLRPSNPISAQCDTSASQTPPKIVVDRPQSDSSLSLQSVSSPSKCDDAVIQRASVVRKSSASILDYSSVRMSKDVFGNVVQESRCRVSSIKISDPTQKRFSSRFERDSYESPISSRSPSQSPNLSCSFAWSGKRFSSSTAYTVPSPNPSPGSAFFDRGTEKASLEDDPFITETKVEHSDSALVSDIALMRTALELIRESKEHFPDSIYSQSIMDFFVSPQTLQDVKQFLHQSKIAFTPLNHEGLPSSGLRVVEIVEGRDPYDGKRWTQNRIGRTSKRHLMKRMRSDINVDNSSFSSNEPSTLSQLESDKAHVGNESSGDVDMTALSSTFVSEDSPRCMNDTSVTSSYSSQPQQSSPLGRKNSVLPNRTSDISETTFSGKPEQKINNRPIPQPFTPLWSPPQSMIPLSAAMLDVHTSLANGQLTRQESIRTRRLSNIKIVIQSPSTRSSVTSPRSC